MVALGQTITIVNQSGKVVKTSKSLVGVWNEAKSAYNERKAEIKAFRASGDVEVLDKELKARRQFDALTLRDTDNASERSSRRGSGEKRRVKRKPVPSVERERPPFERGVSDSFYANDMPFPGRERRSSHRPSPLRQESSGSTRDPRRGELTRRHTTDDLDLTHRYSTTPTRSASADEIDMDLAYGELPPPLPERKYDTEVELRSKMSGLQRLLDECNCLQHSVTSTIDSLQKNPDQLAAVALSLGEISTLATKLAPGALMSMKGSFPAILALLASPEFAIAIGVGVGVTVIALGGYKIIKKIKAKKEANRLLEDGRELEGPLVYVEPESPASEMDELREIDRIELWRRGIVDAEGEGSLGTSVDGEFVTPVATRTLIEEGKLTEADFKSTAASSKDKKSKVKSGRRRKSGSESGSKASSSQKGKEKGEGKKQPSGLRMLFKTKA